VRFAFREGFPLALCRTAFEVLGGRGVCCAEQTQRASPQSEAAIMGFAGVRIVPILMPNSRFGEVTVVQGPNRAKLRAGGSSQEAFRGVEGFQRCRSNRVGEILLPI